MAEDVGLDGTQVPVPQEVLSFMRSNVAVNTILTCLLVSFGCKMTMEDVKIVLRRPFAILIGVICQVLIQPLVAFLLAHLLQLDETLSLLMTIAASVPGGVASNFYTYYTDGDVTISILINVLGLVAAIASVPFNLWLYTRAWTDVNTVIAPIPYVLIQTLVVVVAVLLGMALRWKLPLWAVVIAKIGGLMGLLAIFLNIILNCFINPEIFSSDWTLWLASTLLILITHVVGFGSSYALCQSPEQSRAVMFGAGAQNVAVVLTLTSAILGQSNLKNYVFVSCYTVMRSSLLLEAIVLVVIYKYWSSKKKEKRKFHGRSQRSYKDFSTLEASFREHLGNEETSLTGGIKNANVPVNV